MNDFDKQALNKALCLELSYLKAYQQSNDDLLLQICEIRKNGVELLNNLAIRQECELDFKDKNLDYGNIKECLFAEKELCEFYEKICENIENEELKDLFLRLWATSSNDYIMALYECFNEQKNTSDVKNTPFLSEDMVKFLEDVKKISQKNASADEIKQTINSPHFSFFCGVAAGGVLAAGINEYLKEKTDEQISK